MTHGRGHYFHVHDHDGLDDDDEFLVDDDAVEVAPEHVPDQVQMLSAAVHIGSATVHFLLTRVTMRRLGVALMSRYEVVDTERLHRSPIWLTPYSAEDEIDIPALGKLLVDGFAAAGTDVAKLDAGIAVLSGPAARKADAHAIGEILTSINSAFVCAAAGPHLEARTAAIGSGATAMSSDRYPVLLNIDVGGETTNIARIESGTITATAAVNVGGRLLVCHEGSVVRISPAGREVARAARMAVSVGDVLRPGDQERLAAVLADTVVDVITAVAGPDRELTRKLLLTDPLERRPGGGHASLSGGVSEYLSPEAVTSSDGPDAAEVDDLGPALANALSARLTAAGWIVHPAPVRMRATVVGLSQFTTQLSGDTVFVSSEAATPQLNLPVVSVDLDGLGAEFGAEDVCEAVRRGVVESGRDELLDPVALSLGWSGRPYFRTLSAIACGVADAAERYLPDGALVVTLTQDCARSLGRALREVVPQGREVVCVDGLRLSELDFIDVGAPIQHNRIVPVVVKTLLFSDSH